MYYIYKGVKKSEISRTVIVGWHFPSTKYLHYSYFTLYL